jgi:hypothetical protein
MEAENDEIRMTKQSGIAGMITQTDPFNRSSHWLEEWFGYS